MKATACLKCLRVVLTQLYSLANNKMKVFFQVLLERPAFLFMKQQPQPKDDLETDAPKSVQVFSDWYSLNQ